jgi:hypothetical protein
MKNTKTNSAFGLALLILAICFATRAAALSPRENHGKVFSIYTYRVLHAVNPTVPVVTFTNNSKTARFPAPSAWHVYEQQLNNGVRYVLSTGEQQPTAVNEGYVLSAFYDYRCSNAAHASINQANGRYESVTRTTINGWEYVVSTTNQTSPSKKISYYVCKDGAVEYLEFIASTANSPYLKNLDYFVRQTQFYLP